MRATEMKSALTLVCVCVMVESDASNQRRSWVADAMDFEVACVAMVLSENSDSEVGRVWGPNGKREEAGGESRALGPEKREVEHCSARAGRRTAGVYSVVDEQRLSRTNSVCRGRLSWGKTRQAECLVGRKQCRKGWQS